MLCGNLFFLLGQEMCCNSTSSFEQACLEQNTSLMYQVASDHISSRYDAHRHRLLIALIFDCIHFAGLRLLGFKSVSMLKHHHQLRSPTFLYPDERSMPGSTQTFIALHAAMLKKNRMAVCSFVRTKAAEPRLVALLPQQEELEDGIQVHWTS